ncbi:MAG: hypothetical protein R2708_02355 [Vicinamibacterales bacterium]
MKRREFIASSVAGTVGAGLPAVGLHAASAEGTAVQAATRKILIAGAGSEPPSSATWPS